jgi:hypothetical protein
MKYGDGLRLLPGSSRAAFAAWEAGLNDLAAELNPHKSELNPIRQSPAVSRAGADQKQRLSAHGA